MNDALLGMAWTLSLVLLFAAIVAIVRWVFKRAEAKLTSPSSEDEGSAPLPHFTDRNGNSIRLSVHPDIRYQPGVKVYTPTEDGHHAEFDCHNESLKPGQSVIWWPNPIERKVHYLCLEHLKADIKGLTSD